MVSALFHQYLPKRGFSKSTVSESVLLHPSIHPSETALLCGAHVDSPQLRLLHRGAVLICKPRLASLQLYAATVTDTHNTVGHQAADN